MVALRVVRAAVLTGFLAVAFLLLVVVGSAIATDSVAVSPAYSTSPAGITLVGNVTVVAAQTDANPPPAQNTGAVVQKTGPAAASTARTIDIVVVTSLGALALWVWVRNRSARKGH
ncbi:MAG TPA: hypothetical protein VNO31_42545 [Umezawaea sp.]|nr:hypothetical protein [Umezawaea sp.]